MDVLFTQPPFHEKRGDFVQRLLHYLFHWLWNPYRIRSGPTGVVFARSGCASLQVSSSGNLVVKMAVMHGAAPCARTAFSSLP
jgi:hypothetical protein